MAFCDFVVKYNPETDTPEDVTERILYTLIVKRIKNNKPVILFISGDSGEGKSTAAIRLQEILCKMQGIDIKEHFLAMNIFSPMEYPHKVGNILEKKELKKVNIVCMHEAREIVKAKQWNSFLTQSVADINAMSRSIKRIATIIISQFIRDITTDVRYTLTYYAEISRPLGKKSRMRLYVMWKDARDLEKPKLKKRKVAGYLVMPNGRYKRFIPQYFEINKPDKELLRIFDEADKESKLSIIRSKLNRLIDEMRIESGEGYKKIDAMVSFYTEDVERLGLIGKRLRGKWRVKKEVQEMHGISLEEVKIFESKLNKALEGKAFGGGNIGVESSTEHSA